jgi:hypothetical protein
MLGFGLPVKSEAAEGLVNGLASKRVTDSFVTPPTDVYVNPAGQGQALIYGYYNARNALDFIKVVNTSTSFGVSAKVRFREGADSNETLDFFICLSAGDEWSGWIVGDGNSANPAQLIWYDNDTPTFPDPNGDNDATNNFADDLSSLVSVPLHYSATGAAPSVSADDTKEGYLGIIAVNAWRDTPGAAKVVETPDECAAVLGLQQAPSNFTIPELVTPPNSLMGTAYNFVNGGTYAYNATALADFTRTVIASPGLGTEDPPRLSSGTDNNLNGTSIDEVNFALTQSEEDFMYDIQSVFAAASTLVETFPTKRWSITDLGAQNPFNPDACIADNGAVGTMVGSSCRTDVTTPSDSGRCVEVGPVIWNDAEQKPTTTTGFSPGETAKLFKCDEVNLIVIGQNAEPLVDSNLVQFNLQAPAGFNFGWLQVSPATNTGTTINSVTMQGLPVITYELQGYIEGGLTHMLPGKFKTNYIAVQ